MRFAALDYVPVIDLELVARHFFGKICPKLHVNEPTRFPDRLDQPFAPPLPILYK